MCGSVLLLEGHVDQHVGIGVVHDGGEVGNLRPNLVGDGAPLGAGGLGYLLVKGGGDEGRDDASSSLSGVRT